MHAQARVRDAAHKALSRAGHAFGDIKGKLDIGGRVRRRPYRNVGVAVGMGYLVGGGLFSPLTKRVLRLGVEVGIVLAALPYLAEGVWGQRASSKSDAPARRGNAASRRGASKTKTKTERSS